MLKCDRKSACACARPILTHTFQDLQLKPTTPNATEENKPKFKSEERKKKKTNNDGEERKEKTRARQNEARKTIRTLQSRGEV